MADYKTFTRCEESGPYFHKLVLELPEPVAGETLHPRQFVVYGERRDRKTGELVWAKAHHTDPDDTARPCSRYVRVLAAQGCDAQGRPTPGPATHVALELPQERMTKPIDGSVFQSMLRDVTYRVTQTEPLAPADAAKPPLAGLVWDRCAGDICPQLDGWDLTLAGTFADVPLAYGFFSPDIEAVNERRAHPFPGTTAPALEPLEKVPLLLWLHGGGEGGGEPYRTVAGNEVTALSARHVQDCLGGAAYVLAPSSPTYWMDSGSGQIEDDNRSCYTAALKALVDQVVAEHPAIDPARIYVGGLSNGGFMTARLLADYPGFFAAAVCVCAPWVGGLATDEEFAAMAQTPSWWVQVDDDGLVPVDTHIKTTWPRLLAAGAKDAHLTYYDHVTTIDGHPIDGHFVWPLVYRDEPRTELDGTNVLWDGFPVTLWQWVGKHRR